MLTRLPRWVWLWIWLLSLMAGIVNVVGVLSFKHQALTHLTGTTTLLASALAKSDRVEILHLLAVLLSFMAGGVVSGAIIMDSTLKLGRRYGVVLLIEALALFLAVRFLEAGSGVGTYLASAACGLQNAMATTYSGAVVRTSHVTGMFTDISIAMGHFLRGVPLEWKRLQLCLIVISAFVTGGWLGGLCFEIWSYQTLNIPGVMALTMALIYMFLRKTGRLS